MDRGDIYLVDLDPTFVHEQKGKRPILVISPKPFNLLTKTPITVPITTGGNFARVAGFTVELKGSKTTGVIRCDQPRATDIRARNGKNRNIKPKFS
jgi:mRNA-degrading endonuclease toxin of MazEF toxin-antitoxin module